MTSDRVGTITAGGTAYSIRLAQFRPQPYQWTTRLVWPEFQDVPGAEGKVSGDPNVRIWHIDEWDQGEGETLWKEGFYNKSANVHPIRVGDGLTLGGHIDLTDGTSKSEASLAGKTLAAKRKPKVHTQ